MADISAQMVKELREKTGAGMMDCKKALVESNGDMEAAIKALREKGLSAAAKKGGRIASEGVVAFEVSSDFNKASIVEINSETDFVAKNDTFKELVANTSKLIFDNSISSVESLNSISINGTNFEEYLKQNIAKIGENIVIRRMATCVSKGNGVVNGYVHFNHKVGAIIGIKYSKDSSREACVKLAKDLAMHASAMGPKVISYKDLDMDFVKSEKKALIAELEKENEEFARLKKPLHKIPTYISKLELTDSILSSHKAKLEEDLKAQNKPEKIWDKIIPGQMDRFVADSTLLDQRLTLLGQFFIMDEKKTIEQALESKSAELGDKIEVVEYVRFELGEGIEKKVEDFASEVAAQIN